MNFALSKNEIEVISTLKNRGISEIWVYRSHNRIGAVTFALTDGSFVNITSRDQHVEKRFEVFLITAESKKLSAEPLLKISSKHYQKVKNIYSISICNWEMPTSEADKEKSLGDTTGSTTIYEGRVTDVPKDALNHCTFDAGIKVQFDGGKSFFVVTADPFELAINHESSNSEIIEEIYDLTLMR